MNLRSRAILPTTVAASIIAAAERSSLALYSWPGRGKMPLGYVKGMGLVYGTAHLRLLRSDVTVLQMVRIVEDGEDVFDHLENKLADAGMIPIGATNVDRLRILHVILYALGVRESSGRYCCGLDMSAPQNANGEEAEAGPFQQSYNSRAFSVNVVQLMEAYLADPSYPSFIDIFKEGVVPKANDLHTYGAGKGATFQQLVKSRPEYAAEIAALVMRTKCGHWGPLNREEVSFPSVLVAYMRQVQQIVDTAMGGTTAPSPTTPTKPTARTWGQLIADLLSQLFSKRK